MEQIMEMIDARKSNIKNIKENYYIYQFKQFNELIEEQESIKQNDNQNSMFDIVEDMHTRPQERHREQGYKDATQHTTEQCLKTQHNGSNWTSQRYG
jgi:hypothetical protein